MTPTAILTEQDILAEAAQALRERDQHTAAIRDCDNRLRLLRRHYGDAARVWGVAPHHLRQACVARGLMDG